MSAQNQFRHPAEVPLLVSVADGDGSQKTKRNLNRSLLGMVYRRCNAEALHLDSHVTNCSTGVELMTFYRKDRTLHHRAILGTPGWELSAVTRFKQHTARINLTNPNITD